jgi:hypothetical protein
MPLTALLSDCLARPGWSQSALATPGNVSAIRGHFLPRGRIGPDPEGLGQAVAKIDLVDIALVMAVDRSQTPSQRMQNSRFVDRPGRRVKASRFPDATVGANRHAEYVVSKSRALVVFTDGIAPLSPARRQWRSWADGRPPAGQPQDFKQQKDGQAKWGRGGDPSRQRSELAGVRTRWPGRRGALRPRKAVGKPAICFCVAANAGGLRPRVACDAERAMP